jgi:hypothetical protein
MATTTPNYGWSVPTSTDLVTNGATAIETLGDAIDASMNTALGTKKAGMVLLNTTSFSGVTTQSVSDVFSATYDFYKIVVYSVGSQAANLSMRYRVAGADNSTTNYNFQLQDTDSTTVSASRLTAQTLQPLTTNRSAEPCSAEVIVFNPFATLKTTYQAIGFDPANVGIIKLNFGVFSATTSFTGFTLVTTGTMTGSVSTYGFNK